MLHRAMHDHASELLRFDSLEIHSHVDGLRQRLQKATLSSR